MKPYFYICPLLSLFLHETDVNVPDTETATIFPWNSAKIWRWRYGSIDVDWEGSTVNVTNDSMLYSYAKFTAHIIIPTRIPTSSPCMAYMHPDMYKIEYTVPKQDCWGMKARAQMHAW